MLSPKKRKDGYFVDFRHGGKRIRRKFLISEYGTIRESKRMALEFLKGFDTPQVAPSTISRRILDYHQYSQVRKSPNTMRNQKQMLQVFEQFLNANNIKSFQVIRTKTIQDFQSYYFDNYPFNVKKKRQRRWQSDGKATWEKYRQAISAFFTWAVSREYLPENPASKQEFKLKQKKKIVRHYTPEEVADIFTEIEIYDDVSMVPISTFYRLLLYTGMRLSEAILLKWKNCKLSERKIFVVEDSYRFSPTKIARTKSKEERAIPIHPTLHTYLTKLPQDKTFVFDSGENTPLYQPNRYWKELNRVLTKLGIDGSVHTFRHTFAYLLCQKNVDLRRIQRLMGHQDIHTTMQYIDFYPEDFREAIDNTEFE